MIIAVKDNFTVNGYIVNINNSVQNLVIFEAIFEFCQYLYGDDTIEIDLLRTHVSFW